MLPLQTNPSSFTNWNLEDPLGQLAEEGRQLAEQGSKYGAERSFWIAGLLELEDKKDAALTIYATLAEQGRSEAMYQYSQVVLLTGGTYQQINDAFRYLRSAASALHDGAISTLRLVNLLSIACNFEELNKFDGLPMPLNLQGAIVKAIMYHKQPILQCRDNQIESQITRKAMIAVLNFYPIFAARRPFAMARFVRDACSPIESYTITQSDLITVLDDLDYIFAARHPDDMDYLAEKIPQKFRQHDLASLLADGLINHNNDHQTTICISAQESTMPDYVWNYVGNYLSVGENINLSNTSHSHFRRQKEDVLWQKRVTEERIESILKSIYKGKSGNFYSWTEGTLDKIESIKTWILSQLGNVTIDQLQNMSSSGLDALSKPVVQMWLDEYPQYFYQIVDVFENGEWRALKNPWIRNRIADQTFTLAQFDDSNVYLLETLLEPEVQDWLDQHPVCLDQLINYIIETGGRFHFIDAWTILFLDLAKFISDNNLTLEDFDDSVLSVVKIDEEVNSDEEIARGLWFARYPHYVRELRGLPRIAVKLLTIAWVRDRIVEETFSFKQLSGITKGGRDALRNEDIQRWLDQHPIYAGHIFGLSKEAGVLLTKEWIRDLIANETVTFERLNGIAEGAYDVLCNSEVQDWLEKNPHYLDHLLTVSEGAVYVLQDPWVRARLDNKTLTFAQLDGIADGVCDALSDSSVQDWLETNPQHLDQTLALSEMTGRALHSQLVRDLLEGKIISPVGYDYRRRKPLTFEQLNSITDQVAYALDDMNVQIWLYLHPEYIDQVLNSPKLTEAMLTNAWVREHIGIEGKKVITFEQINDMPLGLSDVLCNPTIQGWLDQNPHYLSEIFVSSSSFWALVRETEFMKSIKKGDLHMGEINDLIDQNRNASTKSWAVKFLHDDLERVQWFKDRFADKTLSFEQFYGPNIDSMRVIYRHTDLKNWLDKHPQHIGQTVAVPKHYIEVFNPLIGDCIAKGLFTFEQLASVTQAGYKANRDPKIQDWLKQEQQYAGQVLLISKWAAKALRYAWVRQEVTDGTLAFEQLANINLEEYRVLITKRTVAHLAQKTVEM